MDHLFNLRHLLSLNAVREKTCVPCWEIGTGVLLTQLEVCHWCPCSIAWEQESEFPYKTGRTEKAFFSGLYEMFFILKKKSANFFVVEKSQHCCNRGHLATQFDQGFRGVFLESKLVQSIHPWCIDTSPVDICLTVFPTLLYSLLACFVITR